MTMKYESGICANCGKKKEVHSPMLERCPESGNNFTDSGLQKVQANATAVLEAAQELMRTMSPQGTLLALNAEKALEAAINKSIEP